MPSPLPPHDHFRSLLAYDRWAARRTHDALAAAGAPDRPRRRFAHTAWASRLWLCRARALPAPLESTYLDRTLPDLLAETLASNADWLALLDAEPDLARAVRYRNTRGVEYVSRLADILTHLVNHASYHRGQIAADLAPAAPPVTDFIAFARGD